MLTGDALGVDEEDGVPHGKEAPPVELARKDR